MVWGLGVGRGAPILHGLREFYEISKGVTIGRCRAPFLVFGGFRALGLGCSSFFGARSQIPAGSSA